MQREWKSHTDRISDLTPEREHTAESSAFTAEAHFGHAEEEQVSEHYLRAHRVICQKRKNV